MEVSLSFGYCDQCYKGFNLNQEIIYLKQMKDKMLNLQFCNDDCLNKAKNGFHYLKDFDYETCNIDKSINDKVREANNVKIIDLVKNYPQHIIKNYDDLIIGKSNQPVILNGIELLDKIIEYGEHDIIPADAEDFLNLCLDYNLF